MPRLLLARMIRRALILPIKCHTYIAIMRDTNTKVDVGVATITFIFVLGFGITILTTKCHYQPMRFLFD